MDGFKLSIETIAAVGTFLSGIIMLITFIQVVSRIKFKEEVYYGTEAKSIYEEIKDGLLKDSPIIKSYKYEGGNNKIVPRIEFEKFVFNHIFMKPELKKYKKRVLYFDKDEVGDRIVTTYYLK